MANGLADRSDAIQRRMSSVVIVVVCELQHLPFEICSAPDWDLVQKLSSERAGQAATSSPRLTWFDGGPAAAISGLRMTMGTGRT